MSSEGWVAVSRDLLDARHELHPHTTGDPACELGAWVDLIGYARWANGGGLQRGQLRGGVRFLAARWNWSKSRVSRFLRKLEAAGRIICESRAGREPDVITVCNYDAYQNVRDTSGTRAGHGWVHERDTGEDKEEQEQEQEPSTAAAVGDFLDRTGSGWRLDTEIREWCHEIEREPKYAGADIPYEVRKCAEWHIGRSKRPKAPDISIRNWLERAAKQSRNGPGAKRDVATNGLPMRRL